MTTQKLCDRLKILFAKLLKKILLFLTYKTRIARSLSYCNYRYNKCLLSIKEYTTLKEQGGPLPN